jgi:ribosomal protein L37AE/L43A
MRIAADTFECPNCGTKVLENTGYCVKCKKKVKKASKISRILLAKKLLKTAKMLIS